MNGFFNVFAGVMGGMAGGPEHMVFEETYRAYSMAMAGKDHNDGDKILMPSSALQRLTMMHVQYPMMFKISNPRAKRTSHCGVMEFSADEGKVYLPQWMMQNLIIEEGSMIMIRNVQLPKGRFVKFRPHSKDFLDISNPRAVLEKQLRLHSCVTKGDVLMFTYVGRQYYIDIMEVRPADAVSIIETDMEVDFDAPVDYVEPTRTTSAAAGGGAGGGRGGGMEDDDVKIVEPSLLTRSDSIPIASPPAKAPSTFVGAGRRLGDDAPVGQGAAAGFGSSPAGGVILSRSPSGGAGGAKPKSLNKFEARKAAQSFQGKGMSLKDDE